MKSGAFDRISGVFAFGTAPFAVHPLDRARAALYLHDALMQGLCWDDVERDIRAYLAEQGWEAAAMQGEIERARPLFQPWLS